MFRSLLDLHPLEIEMIFAEVPDSEIRLGVLHCLDQLKQRGREDILRDLQIHLAVLVV